MSFPLIGNSKIKQSVENCLREKRLPHAILIEGDEGTGRHTLAYYLASAAVCGGEQVPCGECRDCKMASGSNHPDIAIVAPLENKKNIAVSQVRELKSEAYVKPHMAHKKVFLIEEADTLNEQAQNALLKVLEEPPEAVIFILIAQSKASFLDTIISRCVVLTLSTPEKQQAAEFITSLTDFDTQEIADALDAAQNNIGRALQLLSGKSATEAEEFFEYMLRRDSWGMLKSTVKAEKNRAEAALFFKDLKRVTVAYIKKNVSGIDAAAFTRLYSEICELEKSLTLNINLGLLFCTLVSRAEKLTNNRNKG